MGVLLEVMEQNIGCIVVSVILGLGIAALFYKVCEGRSCIVMKGPDIETVTKDLWRYGNNCYSYTYKEVPCPNDKDKNSVA